MYWRPPRRSEYWRRGIAMKVFSSSGVSGGAALCLCVSAAHALGLADISILSA